MARRKYSNPVLLGLDDGGDQTISFGSSQGTTGEDSIFSFDPQVEADDLFGLYDDTDFAEMDTNGDSYISWDEYAAYAGIEP